MQKAAPDATDACAGPHRWTRSCPEAIDANAMLLWLALAAVRVHAKRASDAVAMDDNTFWTQSLDCPPRPTGTATFLTPDGSNAADVLGSTTGAFLTILAEHLERTPCIFARLANTVRPFRFKRFVIVVDSAEKTAAGTARATARLDAFDPHWLNATCAFADEVRVAVLDHGPTPNALAHATLARVTTNATAVWRRRGELYKNALQYLSLFSGVLLCGNQPVS